MRIAFVTIVPAPYQRDLFRALAARDDVELAVIYLEDEAPDSPWPKRALADYETVLPGRWLALGRVRWHFHAGVPAVGGYDVVVVNGFMSRVAQRLMRRELRGRRWLFWGERLRVHRGWKRWVQGRLTAPLGRAAGIVAIGRMAADDYGRRFPGVPVFNVPYHCELGGFFRIPPRTAADGRPFVFLFCGQMIGRKGVDILLEAFAGLAGGGADVRLLLVGREAELPDLLRPLPPGVRGLIEYAGFQAPEDLAGPFARADAFVLPSRHDGWGVVVNQALGAGLPIICSDAVGAGPDLVTGGSNGRIFSSGDAVALQAAMRELVMDPVRACAWGGESRRLAADWTPESGAKKWAAVFREVLKP